jgi:hypothetical protein
MMFANSRNFLIILCLLPIACIGRSRVGAATVTEKNGLPCFSIAEGLVTTGVEAVNVFDNSANQSKNLWKVLAALDKKLSESPDVCIPYGKKFNDADIKSEYLKAAEPLSAGKIYEVVLVSPPKDSTDPTHGFRAKFCLKNRPSSTSFDVYQIQWDEKKSRWNSDVCSEN